MTSKIRFAGILIACGLVGNVIAEALRGLRDSLSTDFVSSFFTAADMLRHGDHAIYCSSCLQAHAQQLFHAGPAVFGFQYDNPALGAWLLQPLTYLGPTPALECFLLVSLIAVATACWMLRDPLTGGRSHLFVATFAFASFPAAMTFAYGQWDAMLALAAAGAFIAVARDRQLLAGLLISVLLLKPQLAWLVPIPVALAGSWRVLWGILVGGAAWLLSSIAILGWPHTLLWLHQISPNIVARTGISLPHVLVSFGATSSLVVAASAALGGLATLALILRRRQLKELRSEQVLSLGLFLSLLTAPHLLPYDLIVLAPLLVVWARTQELPALGAALVFSAAFLVDQVVPMPWGLAEAAALLGVAALYCIGITGSTVNTRISGARVFTANPSVR
jgi:glycosyl transferase family 87